MKPIVVARRATFSECGRYRYELLRELERPLFVASRRVCFVMLNPSVGNGEEDDPTLRRCMGYAQAWGFDLMSVVNLFGWVSTDPRQLRQADDPIGPRNDEFLFAEAGRADRIVVAWGDKNPFPERSRLVTQSLRDANRVPFALGLSQAGNPRHPLMMPGNAQLLEFRG